MMNRENVFLIPMAVFEIFEFYWELFEEGDSELAEFDGVGEFRFVSLLHCRFYKKWKINTDFKKTFYYLHYIHKFTR